ncbi:hypothetical protein Trydic_g20600 [Trypoxylus dichotomus]
MFLAKFKEEINKYPCIFDKTCSAYKDKQLKKAAWEKVAAAITGKKVWSATSTQQKKAKVKSLKSKWQMISRKQRQRAEALGRTTIQKKGNIMDFFRNKQGNKTGNKINGNDNKETKINYEDNEHENKGTQSCPDNLDVIGDGDEKEYVHETEEYDDNDREDLLSLLPIYKLLRNEDKMQLKIWIKEKLDYDIIDSS